MKSQYYRLLCSTLLGCLLLASQAIALPSYTITDLGALNQGRPSYAHGINNSGQVVGFMRVASGASHGFLYDEETGMTDLGTTSNWTNTYAYDINNEGQVVGSGYANYQYRNVFVYQDGVMTSLGSFGDYKASANGINDSGQIVVETHGPYTWYPIRSFLHTPDTGETVNIGKLGDRENTYAKGINNFGQVVGYSRVSSSSMHAFVYDVDNGMVDIGTLVGLSTDKGSSGNDINDLGQVVGTSDTGSGSYSHAMLYTDGEMIDLGTLGNRYSTAYAINNLGQVVGTSDVSYGNSHAFIWENGVMLDLNDLIPDNSGWEKLEYAYDINDWGQIVGYGTKDGQTRAFMMTLIQEPPVAETGSDQTVFSEVTLAVSSEVTFDGSDSFDRDGSIASYEWGLIYRGNPNYDRFANGINPTVPDLEPGFYDVTLTVTDDDGATATDTMILAVSGECSAEGLYTLEDLEQYAAQSVATAEAAKDIIINDLTAQLATADADIAALEATKADLEIQLAAANTENANLTVQLATANTDIAALQAAKVDLENQLAAANTENANLTAQLATANTDIAALEATKADLEIQLAAANTDIAALSAQITQNEATIAALNAQITQNEQTINSQAMVIDSLVAALLKKSNADASAANAVKTLAQETIDQAMAGGAKAKEIVKAQKEMDKAQKELNHTKKDGTPDPKYDKAIDHYKKAWKNAQHAMKHVKKAMK